MPVRQLVLSTDGEGGEFRVEADYVAKPADPTGKAIDYYNGFFITNTTQQPGAVYVAARDAPEGQYVAGPFPIPANYPRTYTDVSALGNVTQRRRYDLRPQWPA